MLRPLNLLAGCLLLVITSFAIEASDNGPSNTLTIDRTVVGDIELQFPNNQNIHPKSSPFKIVNYVLMSSESGDRWATVTIKNDDSGSRHFNNGHVLALFADGQRKRPLQVKSSFAPGQTQTFVVSFGSNKFPILKIYTRH